jgi:hypothetical protein
VESRTIAQSIRRGRGLPRSFTHRKQGMEKTRKAAAIARKSSGLSSVPSQSPSPTATYEPRYPTPTPIPPILPRFSSVLTSGSIAS